MSGPGRRWLELRVRCASVGDIDALLADALVGLGARGVEERAGWFVAYFTEPDDPEAFVRIAARSLASESGLDDLSMEHGWQDHEDWAETWKRGLAPRRLGTKIVVHPSWIAPTDLEPDDVVIVIDPGMAFGTAEHGTTRGSIRLLESVVVEGNRVLDVGAGSGILAIVAARLGATEVVAIEGDPLACEALRENLEHNGVQDRVRVVEAWATREALAAYAPVNGIVANIEAGLLLPLFEGFRAALAEDGWLVVSGILAHEWEGTRASLEDHGFVYRAVDADGEWRSGLFRRRSEVQSD
jgi:ribosomal protein L11 methyltransferase